MFCHPNKIHRKEVSMLLANWDGTAWVGGWMDGWVCCRGWGATVIAEQRSKQCQCFFCDHF